MFKRIKSKYRAIERAEKAAEEFKKRIDIVCNNEDFSFILCLLQADEKAEEIGIDLGQAYDNMEEVCQDNKDKTILSELITDNIMSYISHQNLCVYNEIDDKVHDLKQQIFERRILKSPKFEFWQGMGVTDKEWNLIKMAAEETQNTGNHKKLEQCEQAISHYTTGRKPPPYPSSKSCNRVSLICLLILLP